MRYLLLGIISLIPLWSHAQESEKKFEIKPDLHFRTFWMSTSYPDDFKNDFALGTSLGVGTKLSYGEHWSAKVSYRGFLNVWSSEIWEPDPLTNRGNRYETGLYDLLNPEDGAFGSWENLSLNYQSEKFDFGIGRMGINTPWINPQDGRLAPTMIEGATFNYRPEKSWEISVWYIYRMRVRGTKDWLRPGETVGIFPVARDVNGQPSQYYGNTKSDGVTVFEVSKKSQLGKFELSHTWAHNLFATYWTQWQNNWKSKSGLTWITGLQFGYQHGVENGGNSDPLLRYKDPNDKNWVVSGRFGLKKGKILSHLNFTKLGGEGRWLSPREWGKDAWYTFVPRERNEGYKSVEAFTAYLEYSPNSQWSVYSHLGFHWLPDVSDFQANKYAFPSYRQLNLGVKYNPESLRAMDFHLLVMNKEAIGDQELSAAQRYNKVEMIHVNLMINWRLN